MKVRAQIKKWGNSAALRLPARLLARAGFEIDSRVEIEASEGQLLINATGESEYKLDELLAQCPPRKMVLSEEDEQWLESPPVGREAW